MVIKNLAGWSKEHFLPISIILITSILEFLPGYSPVIYSDDWNFLFAKYASGKMLYIDWASRRPLENAGFKILLDVFGLNVKALYLSEVFFIFACAVGVYFLVRRAFPRLPFLAIPAALVFLVYPVDYTRMWLIQVYTWMIYLAILAALILLFDFAKNGRWWNLTLALILIAFSLGAYEAQLGIILAWCAFLAVFTQRIPLRRRLLLLLPFLVAAGFTYWRLVLQPTFLHVVDPYLAGNTLSPFTLLRRLAGAFPVFVESWVLPFKFFLDLSTKKMLFIVATILAVGVLLALWSSRNGEGAPEEPIAWEKKKNASFPLLGSLAIGVGMMLAGYIPIAAVYTPNLSEVSSRANLFAIFGGSLALVSLIGLAALLSAKFHFQVSWIISSLVIPLVLIGVILQIWNQNEADKAWKQQKIFWREMFTTLPNLKDKTTVVVVVDRTEPVAPFERLPVTSEWELSGGLEMMYNNFTLQGMLLYPRFSRLGNASFKENGVQGLYQPLTAYQSTIFVLYDPASRQMKIIRDLKEDLKLPFTTNSYHPDENLIPSQATETFFRRLVK